MRRREFITLVGGACGGVALYRAIAAGRADACDWVYERKVAARF